MNRSTSSSFNLLPSIGNDNLCRWPVLWPGRHNSAGVRGKYSHRQHGGHLSGHLRATTNIENIFTISGKFFFYSKTNKMHNFRVYWISLCCFGRSFHPSSGVQGCTYIIKYMSYRFVDYLLAGMNSISYPLASSQRICMTYTWRCMYSLGLLMMDGKTIRNM